jgi:hypothetical protein
MILSHGPEFRELRFEELDRLIKGGLGDIPQPVIQQLSKTELYTIRRRTCPRKLKHRIEPWEVRRQKYLIEKALPEFSTLGLRKEGNAS